MKELALIGFSLSFFFILQIVTKKNKRNKDIFLSLLLFTIGWESFFNYLTISGLDNSNLVSLIDNISWTLMGPTLYLYTIFLVSPGNQIKKSVLLHTIPLFLTIAVYGYYYFFTEYNSFLEYYYHANLFTKLLIWQVYLVFYFGLTLHHLQVNRKKLKNYFSNIEKRKLTWLSVLTSGLAIYMFFFLIYYFILIELSLDWTTYFNPVLTIFFTIYVILIGLYGFRQEGIFSEQIKAPENQNIKNDDEQKTKYKNSGLNESEKSEIIKKLTSAMEIDKIYIESDLTIHELANKVDTSIHKLSQIINETYDESFFDFINKYRIEEARKQLINPDNNNLKIIAIAYDCGYNSKSTFYSVFKKLTNMTPTEYRNQYKNKE